MPGHRQAEDEAEEEDPVRHLSSPPWSAVVDTANSCRETQKRRNAPAVREARAIAPRVVIVGGGFGGLACARALAGKPVEVTLVDSRDYHLFTPLLYQVATALLNPADIAYPFRAVLRSARNVRFHQGTVRSVEFDARVVRTGSGRELAYDHLVLATGSVSDYFGNDELARATLGMKSLPQAQRLRNHVLACLEEAAHADAAELAGWLTFVVVGGGPTGVEFAGALAELKRLVGREYPEFPPEAVRIVVVEGAERLLPAFPEKLGRYAQRVLERRSVEVRTGVVITSATGEQATLSSGETIDTHTVVWSAGVRARRPDGTDALPTGRAQRLAVDERLRVGGRDEVFVVGDLADGLPMLSAPAMQQGRYAARAILASIAGCTPPPPFRYRDKGTMAVIGRNAAVADVFGLRLTGFVGWVAWLA
ncbi:MAG: NAD(P)/FAD-dependent oxidoreductase, partial [Actinobacteria bacterium]|nr:NAD(P)/FAD-dependent oxidoreductase [Actinomycetota bacterium]